MTTTYETAADYADADICRAKEQAAATLRAQAAEELKTKYPKLEVGEGATIAAKNLRQLLKAEFPGIKFSVKTRYFSGGDAVDVRWIDGPTRDAVEAIANRFERGTFSGMDDSYTYEPNAWNKTFGSTRWMNCTREYSDALVERAMRELEAEYGEAAPSLDDYRNGRGWNTGPSGCFSGGLSGTWQGLINERCAETEGALTMSNDHTTAPWHIEVTHVTEGAYTISHGVNRQGDGPEGDVGKFYCSGANARRIVACVNACEGIPTEALECQSKRKISEAWIKQRDALTDAINRLIFAAECRDNTMGDPCRLIEVKAELAAAAAEARAVVAGYGGS